MRFRYAVQVWLLVGLLLILLYLTIQNTFYIRQRGCPYSPELVKFNATRIQPYYTPTVHLSHNFTKRVKSMKPFTIQISLSERELMMELLQIFDKFITETGIPYMIYGGTLLGSYRHHDIIPWDDDLDVLVRLADRPLLRKYFKVLRPTYVLTETTYNDKFFHVKGKKASHYNWLWPYVDISYFDENSTHLWNIARPYGKATIFPKAITYPFHRRPLNVMNLPAPKDTFAALMWMYGFEEKCKQFAYSHMIESSGPSGEVLCKDLADKYPFVHHYPSHNGKVMEVLKFKKLNLTNVIVDEPSYAIADTHGIKLKPGYSIPVGVPLP